MADTPTRYPFAIEENETFGVVEMDRSGVITYWNRGAEIITYFSKEDALGQLICLFFTELDKERGIDQEEIRQAIKMGKSEDERWHMRKDGSRFWATGALTKICDKEGDIIGFCKIFRDNTAAKLTEERIHIANAELNRFAQTASHDLLQPIRTVSTYIELAMQDPEISQKKDLKEFLQIALDASQRMRKLTNDLLTYAEVGARKGLAEWVDCNAALDMAVENLTAAIQETKGLVHRGALPELPGVPTQIAQVFQNLISNSLKYRHAMRPPRIFVDATCTDNRWRFSVEDNGIGIDPRDQERIFGAFERGRSETSSSGSGLGLSIVKKIIEAHGGTIWVDSQVGVGTTFYFVLPA